MPSNFLPKKLSTRSNETLILRKTEKSRTLILASANLVPNRDEVLLATTNTTKAHPAPSKSEISSDRSSFSD
jgi:hypothetical protein